MQNWLDRVERFLTSRAARRRPMAVVRKVAKVALIGTYTLALLTGLWVLTPPGEQYVMDQTSLQVTQQMRDKIVAEIQHAWAQWNAHPVFYAHAQGVLGPFVPTNVAIAASVITPSGSGVQKYIITPTSPLISATTEIVCTAVSNANGSQTSFAATDQVLPPYISATTPGAGSPPNYIVLQISSTQAMLWRCSLLFHPF